MNKDPIIKQSKVVQNCLTLIKLMDQKSKTKKD